MLHILCPERWLVKFYLHFATKSYQKEGAILVKISGKHFYRSDNQSVEGVLFTIFTDFCLPLKIGKHFLSCPVVLCRAVIQDENFRQVVTHLILTALIR